MFVWATSLTYSLESYKIKHTVAGDKNRQNLILKASMFQSAV
jgi:hypothetical protein